MDNDNAREIPDELFDAEDGDEMQEMTSEALSTVERASDHLREGFLHFGEAIREIVEGFAKAIQGMDWEQLSKILLEAEAEAIATEAMNGKEVEVPED